MKEFHTLDVLLNCFGDLGTQHVYCKLLAENDNSKQQIYLGSSFDVLKLLVFGTIRTEPGLKRPNFKTSIPLYWLDGDGQTAQAAGAQLILYPDYPEVRLSGFLQGCAIAPSHLLQPIQKELRQFNNGRDGRVMFFGVTNDKIYVYLAAAGSSLAAEILAKELLAPLPQSGTLQEIIRDSAPNPREVLLAMLREIHAVGWHPSQRLNKFGVIQPYSANNGGGYTLESLFGIIPNGRSAPDYMGWELKAYSGSRITLMTPEPDAGLYCEQGVEAFLRKYGRPIKNDVIYFTGSHKAKVPSTTSGHTLTLAGFDDRTQKVTDVSGGIRLMAPDGEISAEWTFAGLIEKWGRKHAAAAYIPYSKSLTVPPEYKYSSSVLIGEGTDFSLFLSALAAGKIIYDPAPKLENAAGPGSRTKARSQFRMNVSELHQLYGRFEKVNL